MENNKYIVIYDNIVRTKLNQYENIMNIAEENNFFLVFIINNKENHHLCIDILSENQVLLQGLLSNKINIYFDNVKEFIKKSFCVFYFLENKDYYFTKNIKEIISFNKYILHKKIDKYKALINVLKELNKNSNHIFNQTTFINYYDKLNGTEELNNIFSEFKNNNVENNIKKIKSIKKIKTEEKNININLKKDNSLNMNNIYCTFYINTEHILTNDIQIKCIIENCKNKLFNKYIIISYNKEDYLKNYLKNVLSIDIMNNIIFIQNDNETIFKIYNIINYLNTNYLGDIVYLARSDIIIPQQDKIKNIQLKLLESKNIYAISRIERKLDGVMFKDNFCNSLLYSHLQDLYIFKPFINIDLNNNIEIYNNLDYYSHNFEILFNKLLESSGYNIINDTINCKILRIMCSDNVNERHIMKENSIIYKDYNCSYIAENNIINKYSLENYLNNVDLTEEEIYLVKQYIFKLFIKKNNLFKN